jgi:hypothetical protein
MAHFACCPQHGWGAGLGQSRKKNARRKQDVAMRPAQLLSVIKSLTLAAIFMAPNGAAQQIPNLPALTAEELALKDAPVGAAGAAAIVLYYGVEADNAKSTEVHALRIKVLREEGKKYADIEIPYIEKSMQVAGIRARVVGPDGKSTDFGDEIYDREIVKAKKFHMNAKVMTLPNVQVGSIIEYTYCVPYKQKVPAVFRHPQHYLISAGFTYSDDTADRGLTLE